MVSCNCSFFFFLIDLIPGGLGFLRLKGLP